MMGSQVSVLMSSAPGERLTRNTVNCVICGRIVDGNSICTVGGPTAVDPRLRPCFHHGISTMERGQG